LSALNAIIPAVSALYLGRTAERTTFPRARAMIEKTGSEGTSGTLVLVKFGVAIEAYVLDDDATEVGGLIEKLMNWHNGMQGSVGWNLPNGLMIQVKPLAGGTTKPTGEQRGGKDVVMVSSKWEALVEGERETL
jgi:hypothetical protein